MYVGTCVHILIHIIRMYLKDTNFNRYVLIFAHLMNRLLVGSNSVKHKKASPSPAALLGVLTAIDTISCNVLCNVLVSIAKLGRSTHVSSQS